MHFTRLGTTAGRAAAALVLLGWSLRGSAQEPPTEPPAVEAEATEGAVEAAPGEAGVEASATGEVSAEEAAATETEATAEAPTGAPDSEIVVTGTRIKRAASFSLPASVAVADRKELAQSGANNMADVVRNMSINYGSDLNTDVSTNSGGSSQFNLRGLGLSSTLVLLNGRRLVLSGALSVDGANFVDTSTLPLQAVERMEVLKGGASSIYGSDAVAGVVNIITRKRMTGFEAQAGYQTTGQLDQHEWDASIVGGAQGETTRLVAMAAYMKREPLTADKRSFTEYSDPTAPNANTSTNSNPSVFVPLPRGVAPQFRDPGCGTAPLTSQEMSATGAPVCRFNFNRYFHLVPDEQRFNAYLSVEQDLGPHAMLFLEAAYARNRASRILSPSLALSNPVVVPADNEWNPTGFSTGILGRIRGGAYPPWAQSFDSDTLHTVLGAKGDFGGLKDAGKLADWTWELAGTWSSTRYRQTADDTGHAALQTALGSCNPASPTYNPADCWNPYSFGAPNSTELYKRLNTQIATQQDNELTTMTLDFSGPVVQLPGGDLSLAIGAQVRRDVGIANPDHTLNVGDAEFGSQSPDWTAERRIWAGYGELSAPLLQGLEVQAAGRIEQFSDVGSSGFNPMLGLSWTPAVTFNGQQASQISRVRVHGTFATSFVAPSLLQAQGVQNVSINLSDVVLDANGQPVLDPMTGRPTTGASNYVTVRVLGNRDLKPQTSTAFTGGLDWPLAKGVNVALDYWNYSYKQIIIAPDAQNLIRTNPLDPRIQRLGNTLQAVETQFENATETTTHGLDFDANIRSDFGADAGTFSVTPSATYVFSYKIPQAYFTRPLSPDAKCDGSFCDVAGLRNRTNFARAIPRFRFNVPVSWALGGHAVSLTGHFIGPYKDEQFVRTNETAASPFHDISSWLTLDLQYSLRIKESTTAATTVRVGVNNLLGSEPPLVIGVPFNFDTETHDPRGRLIYARLIQEL